MRRHLITPLALVDLDSAVGVDGVALVWVDHNTEETRVGVDELIHIANLQVVQDGRVVQVCQVGHILAFLVLGWVDLMDLVLLVLLSLSVSGHSDLISLGALDQTLNKAVLGIRDPAGLLCIVRLGGVLHLHFIRNKQPLGGVGVGARALLNVARHVGGGCLKLSMFKLEYRC